MYTPHDTLFLNENPDPCRQERVLIFSGLCGTGQAEYTERTKIKVLNKWSLNIKCDFWHGLRYDFQFAKLTSCDGYSIYMDSK